MKTATEKAWDTRRKNIADEKKKRTKAAKKAWMEDTAS